MPSTPRCQEIPYGLIHRCLLTNWKSASDLSNAASIQMLRPPVSTLVSRAVSFTHSGRWFDNDATSKRPDRRDDDQHGEDGERDHRLPRTTTNQASTKTTPTPIAAA